MLSALTNNLVELFVSTVTFVDWPLILTFLASTSGAEIVPLLLLIDKVKLALCRIYSPCEPVTCTQYTHSWPLASLVSLAGTVYVDCVAPGIVVNFPELVLSTNHWYFKPLVPKFDFAETDKVDVSPGLMNELLIFKSVIVKSSLTGLIVKLNFLLWTAWEASFLG